MESESERDSEMDFMIDYEFEKFDVHTLFYLKDNNGNYLCYNAKPKQFYLFLSYICVSIINENIQYGKNSYNG